MKNCIIALSKKKDFETLFADSINLHTTKEIEAMFLKLETSLKLYEMIDFVEGTMGNEPYLLVQPSDTTTDNLKKLPLDLINFIRENITLICQSIG